MSKKNKDFIIRGKIYFALEIRAKSMEEAEAKFNEMELMPDNIGVAEMDVDGVDIEEVVD